MIGFRLALLVGSCLVSILADTSSQPIVVQNEERGIRARTSTNTLNLLEDLVIGVEEGSDHHVFGRIYGIATNSRREIHVLDAGFHRVQRYDSSGAFLQTIGRKGEGPGELSSPTAIAIDASDNLYVADRGRIIMFDARGNYTRELRHRFIDGYVRSLAVDPSGALYISCFDPLDQKIIHKPDWESGHLISFGDSYAVGQDIDVRVEKVIAGGQLDIDEAGVVLYSQLTPYEIRRFAPDGTLLTVIHRENDFMQPPRVEIRDGGVHMERFTASFSVIAMRDGWIVNVVKVPPVGDAPPKTIVDLFNKSGQLVASRSFERDFNIRSRDEEGCLYAVDMSSYPKVVRYRLSLKEP